MGWQKWLARTVLNLIMWWLTVRGRRIRQTPKDLGLSYEPVSFLSRGKDKITLRGWLCYSTRGWRFPSTSSRCIILVPGGVKNRSDPTIGLLEIMSGLVAMGYNVFLFDLRRHGESGGRWRSQDIGQEFEDVLGAFDYLTTRGGFIPERIGILGFSLGAAVSLVAAAKEKRIQVVVAESSFAEFEAIFNKNPGEPKGWVKRLALVLRWCVKKGELKIPNPLNVVENLQAKLFFIHGAEDEAISPTESQRLFNLSLESELWIVEGASHCQSFRRDPEEYIFRVTTFFEKHLL